MTPERWSQVRSLFEQLIELPGTDRASWLSNEAAGDPELLHEVESLMRSYQESDDLLGLGSPGEHVARAARALPDPYEGTTLGPYEILHRIGRGGLGSVYAAVRSDGEHRLKVAIKLVTPIDSEVPQQRFRTERQVLARLDHPNIARLLDGGTTSDGLPYLVMEYVEGQPIDQYSKAHGLTLVQRLQLFRTVCDAVHYAHQSLIVHGDLKPGNIPVTSNGTPKLLNLGIAKLPHPKFVPGSADPHAGLRPMTPDYASPEQIRGDPMTTASDLYSLGVLLYQLLTGHLPFNTAGRSPMEVEKTVCNTDPRPPSEVVASDEKLRKGLQGELDMILLMALRKEPQRRYASVERFSDDIRRHLAGETVLAHRDTLGYRVTKFVSRNRLAVTAAALVIVSLIASAATSQYYRLQAQERLRAALDLSRFVIRDLDRSMQSDVIEARRGLLNKELEYLARLNETARNDPDMQAHLVEGYTSIGDVQGSLFQAHLGEAGEALKGYGKALEIADERVRARPNDPDAAVALAGVHLRIANLTRFQGEAETALAHYKLVIQALEPIVTKSPAPETIMLLTRSTHQSATLLSQLGRAKEALTQSEQSLEWARRWQAKEPNNPEARLNVAIATEWTGRFMADVGRPVEGAERVKEAVEQYERFVADNPDSLKWKRDLLAGLQNLGDVQELSGSHEEAAGAFRRFHAIAEEILAGDPRDQRAQRDVHTACARLITPLLALNRMDEARTVTARALAVLRPLVQIPQPALPDLYQYARLLAGTPFPELRNPPAALDAAKQAVAVTQENDPWMLDLLARACFAAGRPEQAVEAERSAIALLPRAVNSSMRTEFEANLQRWLAAAKQSK